MKICYIFTEYQETQLLCFLMHPGVPQCCSARELTANAFLLPPDVLDAAGLCQSFNILHPAHLWFQLITVSNVFLKEPSTEGLLLVIVLVLFQMLTGFYMNWIKYESFVWM